MFTGQITSVDLQWIESTTLHQAYYLADYLIADDFHNELIDIVLACMERGRLCFPLKSVQSIRNAGCHLTPIYQLAMRSAVRKVILEPKEQKGEEGDGLSEIKENTELMFDILKAVSEYNHKPFKQVWEDEVCTYHRHDKKT